MNETPFDRELSDTTDEHLPASEVAGAHESDGTLGRVAGTGSGAISGGIVGAVFGGPLGAVIGAVAGGALGAAAGEAAHHMGDDHDDVNVETGSDGELGRYAGSGAGGISGAVVGGVTAGPVGAVVGGVAGGMLGAEAGDGAKDMGGPTGDSVNDAPLYESSGPAFSGTADVSPAILPGVPGGLMGLPGIPAHVTMPQDDGDTNYDGTSGLDNPDYDPGLPVESADENTRGTMERFADATGDTMDNDVGRVVLDSDGRPLTGAGADFALNDDRADDTPRII